MTTFTSEDRENAKKLVDEAPYNPGYEDAVVVPFKKAETVEHKKQQWELAFDDWVKLLETANAKELLKDPSASFDEGWRQAAMISLATIQQILGNANPDLIRILEKRLLK